MTIVVSVGNAALEFMKQSPIDPTIDPTFYDVNAVNPSLPIHFYDTDHYNTITDDDLIAGQPVYAAEPPSMPLLSTKPADAIDERITMPMVRDLFEDTVYAESGEFD